MMIKKTFSKKIAFVLSLLLLSISASYSHRLLAFSDVVPGSSVSTKLHHLNVTYHVKKNKLRITLYVINHESFPILCDAQYRSGPDKKNKPEKILKAGEVIPFIFYYDREKTFIHLALICEKPPSETYQEENILLEKSEEDIKATSKEKTEEIKEPVIILEVLLDEP